MRLNATRLGSIASSRSFGDQLDDLAGQVPSLDLNFAQNKSLIDDYSGTTLATHTRASSGTFVDSTGVLRSAVTNLLLRSSDYSAIWFQSNVTPTYNTTEVIDPVGGNTATKFVVGTAGAIGQGVSPQPAVSHTGSIYLRTDTGTTTTDLLLYRGSPFGLAAFKTVTLTTAWQRFDVTGTFLDNTTHTFQFNFGSSKTVYVWGAQLEQSATVGEYIPTTSAINSAPRFDHNPQTGESLGLLVEEARTNIATQSEALDASPWGVSNLTVTANSTDTLSPDGVTYPEKFLETSATSNHTFFRSIGLSITAGTVYTVSVFIKRIGGQYYQIVFDDNITVNGGYVNVDLVNGTITASANYGTGASIASSITQFGNGWFRISITSTAGALSTIGRVAVNTLTSASQTQFAGFAGNTSNGCYLWGVVTEAGAFPTSYIPTVASTVTRAADVAQIAGSNFGTTRTNLLVRSEEFDNASWVKTDLTVTANTNETVAPNGINTADLYDDGTNSGTHYLAQTAGITASTTYTASIYAKKDNLNYINVGITDIAVGDRFAVASFNINNGTVSTSSASGTGYSVLSTSISSAGNGWYRCVIALTTGSTAVAPRLIIASSTDGMVPAGSGGLQAYAGANNQTYVWGAQLEVGSAVTPYIQSPSVFTSRASSGTYVGSDGLIKTATTNEARYDHDPVSLISRGLLLEEARTNLALDSEDFSAATWARLGTTFTVDAVASPTGATTADTLLETATTTEHILYSTAAHTFTTATHSIYVKPNGRTNVALRFYHGIDDWVVRVFSLTGNGSVTQSSAGSSSGFSAVSRSIANAGNGWYRISMTATQTSRATFAAVLDLCTSSTPTLATASGSEVYLGDITKGVYAWGAQLEAASTASSYIPTTASTVTRAADISTSVATSVFESSWYNQTQGTMFTDFYFTNSLSRVALDIGGGGAFGTTLYLSYDVGTTYNINLITIASSVNCPASSKVVMGLAVNNSVIAGAGLLGTVDTSCTLPAGATTLSIGKGGWSGSTNFANGTIKRLTYWPTRLSNEVLQRITQ